MEIIAAAISGLGSIIGGIATGVGFIIAAGIAAATFLVYTETIDLNDVKEFLKKEDKKKCY